MLRSAVCAFALLAASSCSRGAAQGEPSADGGAPAASAEQQVVEVEGHFYPARRCGECHGRQRQQWADSAHSDSAGDAYEEVLAKLAQDQTERCDGCHRPLAEAGNRVAREGVGCDACHTAVAAGAAPRALTLAPEQATRFGPYKDAKNHNFHRVAYSEFVTEGALCAACHQDAPGRSVPEYTTVKEWESVAERSRCTDCHMPSFRGVAAKGEKTREVSRHDFHPDKAEALKAALSLGLQLRASGAEVSLTNTGAHHALPTGRPERRLRVHLEWLGGKGEKLSSVEEVFGRTLVDANGALVPSYLAVREAKDRRLAARGTWTHTFPRPPGAAQLSVRVYYDAFDRNLSAVFGPSEPVLVLERKEAL